MLIKKIFKNQLTKDLIVISMAFLLLIFVSIKNKDEHIGNYALLKAMASVDNNLSGYAWSDNIGWISFNCLNTDTCDISDYGVSVENKKMSGYAWSDNIGWISFNESDLVGCPSGVCLAQTEGNKLIGWARALSGMNSDDGWDGWISLGTQSTDTIDYSIELNEDSIFDGYAWGGTVVGWIDFNPDLGGVTFLGASPFIESFGVNSVATGGKPTTLFATKDADNCDLVSSTGYEDLDICHNENQCANGEYLIDKAVMEETTYTLTCFNDLGMGVSKTITPYKYFVLSSSPNKVVVDFVGSSATTTPTEIEVASFNGFTDDIVFSADLSNLPESDGGETTNAAIFSRPALSFSDYFTGIKTIATFFASHRFTGEKTVLIYGNNLYPVNIIINAGKIDPVYEEI